MTDKDTQIQINEINNKLDLLLQYVDQQRLKTQVVEDLVQDLSIVGNDLFKATVDELEHKNVELDAEALMLLLTKLIKNVGNINKVIGTFESLSDLMQDLGPILQSVGLDVISKIAEFEQKGYFEIFDNIDKNSDKLFNIMKYMSDSKMLTSLENTLKIVSESQIEEADDKSLFGIYKELKKPEIRKTLSFSLRLVQEIYKENNITKLS